MVKLFYSYSHQDEAFRDELEKHLTILNENQLIDEWHDRKIGAGDDLNETIEANMANAHIILLLFSPDFISSKACRSEVRRAIELQQEKGTLFIPIILRTCTWLDFDGISNKLALPTDGKPIKTWDEPDEAWNCVYKGIKDRVESIRSSFKPILKEGFVNDLLSNPVENCKLDELFVYPDILKSTSEANKKLEHNEVDSKSLRNLNSFGEKYLLIEGEEQSGKSSLCNILFHCCPVKH
ncbi:toll/interleukin-1 receptor domain-containing protein [Mariprofundus ferrooxydans]|uniref:toll/interleukin-1 receptor domain-containing protein n=1 Tax=Mariprofundus ferrooxydans TaxID=314344 RepID=UPI000372CFF9|nr:toll/interleukin-1 receptor domain-containing protein [Mariprofundus ferrooxydans]